MTALRGLALLLIAQIAGDGLSRALRLPLPGPVIGLVLVLGVLRFRALQSPIEAASGLLLSNLSLLFVPVGVGVIAHLDLVAQHGVALLAVLLLSTWIGLGVTALVLNAALRRDADG